MKSKTSSDLYDLLGIKPDASLDEIKAQHRKLSKAYHPDVGGETADMQRFDEVQRAYRTLGDPQSRASYDANGDERGSTMVDPIRSAALSMLGGIVARMLQRDDVLSIHLPNTLLGEMETMREQHVNGRAECQRQIDKIGKVLKKLKHKKADQPDILTGIMSAHMELLRLSKEKSENDQKVVDAAIELIEDGYDYTPDSSTETFYFQMRRPQFPT